MNELDEALASKHHADRTEVTAIQQAPPRPRTAPSGRPGSDDCFLAAMTALLIKKNPPNPQRHCSNHRTGRSSALCDPARPLAASFSTVTSPPEGPGPRRRSPCFSRLAARARSRGHLAHQSISGVVNVVTPLERIDDEAAKLLQHLGRSRVHHQEHPLDSSSSIPLNRLDASGWPRPPAPAGRTLPPTIDDQRASQTMMIQTTCAPFLTKPGRSCRTRFTINVGGREDERGCADSDPGRVSFVQIGDSQIRRWSRALDDLLVVLEDIPHALGRVDDVVETDVEVLAM